MGEEDVRRLGADSFSETELRMAQGKRGSVVSHPLLVEAEGESGSTSGGIASASSPAHYSEGSWSEEAVGMLSELVLSPRAILIAAGRVGVAASKAREKTLQGLLAKAAGAGAGAGAGAVDAAAEGGVDLEKDLFPLEALLGAGALPSQPLRASMRECGLRQQQLGLLVAALRHRAAGCVAEARRLRGLAAPMVTEEMKTEMLDQAHSQVRIATGCHAAAGYLLVSMLRKQTTASVARLAAGIHHHHASLLRLCVAATGGEGRFPAALGPHPLSEPGALPLVSALVLSQVWARLGGHARVLVEPQPCQLAQSACELPPLLASSLVRRQVVVQTGFVTRAVAEVLRLELEPSRPEPSQRAFLASRLLLLQEGEQLRGDTGGAGAADGPGEEQQQEDGAAAADAPAAGSVEGGAAEAAGPVAVDPCKLSFMVLAMPEGAGDEGAGGEAAVEAASGDGAGADGAGPGELLLPEETYVKGVLGGGVHAGLLEERKGQLLGVLVAMAGQAGRCLLSGLEWGDGSGERDLLGVR